MDPQGHHRRALTVDYRVRTAAVFPSDYMERAEGQLTDYRRQARELIGQQQRPHA